MLILPFLLLCILICKASWDKLRKIEIGFCIFIKEEYTKIRNTFSKKTGLLQADMGTVTWI
jgi:hypothetical protein